MAGHNFKGSKARKRLEARTEAELTARGKLRNRVRPPEQGRRMPGSAKKP